MLKLFKVLLPLLLLWSCTSNEPLTVPSIDNEPAEVPALTYLALGDSYTIGQSVLEKDRFPVQLSEALHQNNIKINPPQIIAKTGWRTDNLKDAIAEAMPADSFDLVSLLIGVNNQYQGKDINNYGGEFTNLLKTAIKKAGGDKNKVIVLSIPDYAYTPFGQSRPNPSKISEDIDAYNAINKLICENEGVRYFDITPISRQGLINEELVAEDGLHPSGKMYGLWVDLMLEQVMTILE